MDFDFKDLARPETAGIAGSIISLKFSPGSSWSERAINLCASCAIVYFVAPAATEFFSIKTDGMSSFLSFVIGLFGLNFAAQLFDGIKQTKFGEIITDWLGKKR